MQKIRKQKILIPTALLMAVVAITLACLTTGCTTTSVQSARPVEYVVPVRSDLPWQNSGMTVREGNIIHCMAEGKWSDDFGVYGPEGNPSHQRNIFEVAAPANGLLMRISGQTNRVYFVGTHADIVAERSGHIYFRGNAALAPGAQGELTVTLMVARDTDGDGLSDYEEIHIWNTDPLRYDSNGAGFSDEELVSDLRRRPGYGVLQPSEEL